MKDAFLVILGIVFSAGFQYVLDLRNRSKDFDVWKLQTDRAEIISAMKTVMSIQAEIRTILLEAPKNEPLPKEIFILTERIDAEAQFIKDPFDRDIMEELSKIIWWADEISKLETDNSEESKLLAGKIAWDACNEIPVMAGNILRGEKYNVHEKYYGWRDTRLKIENLMGS